MKNLSRFNSLLAEMNKLFALCCTLCLCTVMNAEVLLNEPFGMVQETLAINENVLAGEIAESGWTNVNYSGAIYINGSTNLTYADYQTAADYTGSAEYKETWGKRVATPLAKSVNSGVVYMAAIIRLSGFGGSSSRDYLWALCNGTSGLSSSSNNQFLRLYAQVAEGGFQLGLAKLNEKASEITYSEVLPFGTYLVVAEYEFVAGDNNDVVRLYINPSKGDKPEAALEGTAETQADAVSFASAMLYSAATIKAQALIDDLRVTTDWTDLWADGDEPVVEEPVITVDKQVLLGEEGQTFSDKKYEKTLTVTAEHLKGAITITHINPAIELSTTSLDEKGGQLTITLDQPQEEGEQKDIITFTSGSAQATTTVVWTNTLAKPAIGANILLNGSFEDFEVSSNPMLGEQTSFAEWTWSSFGTTADETDHLDGAVAMHVQPNTKNATLDQQVVMNRFDAGDQFTLTIHYKVNDINNGTLALDCFWEPLPGKDADVYKAHEADKLQVLLTDAATDGWIEKTVVTTMPTGARAFRVRLVLEEKNTDVLFDQFTLVYSGQDEPVDPTDPKDPINPVDPKDDQWANDFEWDLSNPLTLLVEPFDNTEHNKPIALEGWQNVAPADARPWWGFDETKTSPARGEGKYAKATAYQYGQESTANWEMWLVTPALDYKNAQSKVFTFSVMAEYLADEGNLAALEIYYIDATDPTNVFKQDLSESFAIPATGDENLIWRTFFLDLTPYTETMADVFFMAFRYIGPNGGDGAVTYYIDDVSWGRTDLPVISVDVTQIMAETVVNEVSELATINVTTSNVTGSINVAVKGANYNKFSLSAETLPAQGGALTVSFLSDQTGVHEAYIELSSSEAPSVFIPMAILCKETQGLEETEMENRSRKLFRNGQLLIERDGKFFNALGTELTTKNQN